MLQLFWALVFEKFPISIIVHIHLLIIINIWQVAVFTAKECDCHDIKLSIAFPFTFIYWNIFDENPFENLRFAKIYKRPSFHSMTKYRKYMVNIIDPYYRYKDRDFSIFTNPQDHINSSKCSWPCLWYPSLFTKYYQIYFFQFVSCQYCGATKDFSNKTI